MQPPLAVDLPPGDSCLTDEECYGAGFCYQGVCQASNPNVGAACNSTLDCSTDQYCFSSKCKAVQAPMSTCENQEESCPFGTVCTTYQDSVNFFGKPNQSTLKHCVPLFSQDLKMEDADYSTQLGTDEPLLCKTGYAMFEEDHWWCMNPPVSTTTYKMGFEQGAKCFYKAYLDKENPDNEAIQQDFALCGFNTDQKAYCNQREGDKAYQNYLFKYKNILSKGVKCNPLSKKCHDLYSKSGFEEIERQATYIVVPGGNANVAQNDDCVKRSITNQYWNLPPTPEPSSATIFVVGGSLLAFLL